MNSLITSSSAPKIQFYLLELSSSIPHCIVASMMSFVILFLGVRIYFSHIMIWGLNFGGICAFISFFLLLKNECATTYSTNMFFMTVHWQLSLLSLQAAPPQSPPSILRFLIYLVNFHSCSFLYLLSTKWYNCRSLIFHSNSQFCEYLNIQPEFRF